MLDSAEAKVNFYAAAGDLTAGQLVGLVDAVFREVPVGGVSLAAYDPSYDDENRAVPIANRLLESIARGLVESHGSSAPAGRTSRRPPRRSYGEAHPALPRRVHLSRRLGG